MAIRSLAPGTPVPEGAPRRYRSSHGYVRLRWKIGVREYVETYEHRVVDGIVTDAAVVHHEDHEKHNNDQANLSPMTASEHGEAHRVIDYDEVVALYESGLSQPKVALRVGCDAGQVSRILASRGVQTRRKADYAPSVAADRLREAAGRPGASARSMATELGIPVPTVYRLMKLHGVPPFPVGRPRKA